MKIKNQKMQERITTKYQTIKYPQEASYEERLHNIQGKVNLWYGIKKCNEIYTFNAYTIFIFRMFSYENL